MELRIGTCGWSFKDWRGPFYPPGTQDELAWYATQFNAVEIDSTWYHVPSVNTVRSWHRRSPDDFIFCPMLPGEITHERLLEDVADQTALFLEAIGHLNEKLGCIVVQLSPGFAADQFGRLQAFLTFLPDTHRYAVEFRHRSWTGHAPALALLRDLNMAMVMADHPWYPRMEHVTCDFSYLRLLGRRDVFPDYARIYHAKDEALEGWAAGLRTLSEEVTRGYVFVNNQFEGHSPSTVRKLVGMLDDDLEIPAPSPSTAADGPPTLF